ncbi:MAG: polyketide cyclase [Leptolyngbyaceae cyanobacterium RU_5_1]|nr:polyketide cyclase [Leptolyngbyaceae cyanobacterium RU_5_1]
MAEYRFLTVWLLDAPIEKVWEAIVDYNRLPIWWKAIAKVEEIRPGDSTGVGSVCRMTWKTPLSYSLTYESTVTLIEPLHRLELHAVGELEGSGRWEVSTTEAGTLVHYYWMVRTTKTWMNLLALLIRPLMEWNHNAIMEQGGKGLAHYLGPQLLQVDALKVNY